MHIAEETRPATALSQAGACRVLISHPTGNQNVRNALLSLAERDMLAEFWTTLAWDPSSRWNRLLPAGLRAQLSRRAYDAAPPERTRCVPSREIVRLGTRTSLLEKLLCSGERPFSIIGMYRHFDGRVARRLRHLRPDAVYAYEGGALQTFRKARDLGIKTLYELPSGHWYWERNLLSEEAERNPGFASLHPKLKDSPDHMKWKDEELHLADYVFVASRHVLNTLAGVVPAHKIKVINYGMPNVKHSRRHSSDATKPLKVLYCGALIQRKGIGYLLKAIDMLGFQVELTMVGTRFAPNLQVDGACARWRWFQSLPHDQVLDLMNQSDVLVLPSLSEGFGLVVTEALANGLPVILTPNVGASDLVEDGREAFVVPVANSEAIAERIHALVRDRDLLASMSENARATAAARPWDRYRADWANAVREIC